jgi:pyruvate kinase
MLSAETAAGQYPFEAVNIMDRIVARVEQDEGWRRGIDAARPEPDHVIADAIAAAARQIAQTIDASAIATFTASGSTASAPPANARPAPILGLTTSQSHRPPPRPRLGVHAALAAELHSMTEAVNRATPLRPHRGHLRPGQARSSSSPASPSARPAPPTPCASPK